MKFPDRRPGGPGIVGGEASNEAMHLCDDNHEEMVSQTRRVMRFQHSPLWPLMPEIVKMRRKGASLEELGRMHGVTTEFIRQLLNVYLGAEEAKKLSDSRKMSKIAENRRRREYAQLAELLRRCATAKPCPVCGAWVLRSGRTCSAECAEYFRFNRYRISTEDRMKHNVYRAKTYLRKPEKYKASDVRWATSVLSGSRPR